MKTNNEKLVVNNIDNLTNTISQTNTFFLNKVQKQVNSAMTLRNWIIGYYIVEYEQSGKDRAEYGKQLFKAIADRIIKKGVKFIRERHLYLCKDLYKAYPQILRTVSAKSYLVDFHYPEILRTLSAELSQPEKSQDDMNLLLTHLSFSHFIELLKADSDTKRRFYEVQAISK